MRIAIPPLPLLLFLGLVSGCQSPRSAASLIVLEPRDSAPGRAETVDVTGTGFTAGEPVDADFGSGVYAAAEALADGHVRVHLELDPAAPLGTRDVRLVQHDRVLEMLGAFEVRAPFVAEPSSLPAGAVARVTFRGLRTGWAEETSVGGGAHLRIESVDVVSADELTAVLRVDVFTEGGPVPVTIDGESSSSPLSLHAAELVELPPGIAIERPIAPGEPVVLHADAAAQAGRLTLNTPAALLEAFRTGSGLDPVKVENGEIVLDGGDAWFVARADVETSVRASLDVAPLEEMFAGDSPAYAVLPGTGISAYRVAHIAAWCVASLEVNANGGPVAPAILGGRPGSFQATALEAPAGGMVLARQLVSRSAEPLTFTVRDAAGGGGSVQLAAHATPLLGRVEARNGIERPIGADLNDAMTVVDLDPAALGTVHLALDVVHPQRGALAVTLRSPAGTAVDVLVPDAGELDSDVRTVFPDLSASFGDLETAFAGEDPNGAWTLSVTDVSGDGSGVLRGWALGLAPAYSTDAPYEEPLPSDPCMAW